MEKTVSIREMQRAARRAERRNGPIANVPEYWRPKTRGECLNLPRPCPYVGCKYHLAVDVTENGSLVMPHGDDPANWPADTCALDVADRGGHMLEQIAPLAGVVSKERIHQIEERAKERLRASTVRLGIGEAADIVTVSPEETRARREAVARGLLAEGMGSAKAQAVLRERFGSGLDRMSQLHREAYRPPDDAVAIDTFLRDLNSEGGFWRPTPAIERDAVMEEMQATPPAAAVAPGRSVREEKRAFAREKFRSSPEMSNMAVQRAMVEKYGSGMNPGELAQVRHECGVPPARRGGPPRTKAAPIPTATPSPRNTEVRGLRLVLADALQAMRAEGVVRLSITAEGAVQLERQESFSLLTKTSLTERKDDRG